MNPNEQLLITALVAEIRTVFPELFDESLQRHLSQLTRPKEDTFLSRSETCKLFGISLVTLHNWTKTRKLHAHKIAGSSKVYYSQSEVHNPIPSSKKNHLP